MRKLSAFCLILTFLSGCSSDDIKEEFPKHDIYIAGYGPDPLNNNTVPMLWKNGEGTQLSSGQNIGRASGVAVLGNDVYVIGYEFIGGNFVAKYWKNGVAYDLTDGMHHSEAAAIFISGTDVYIAGSEYNNFKSVPKYWKNGVATALSSTVSAFCKSIFVSGSDVYVVGIENNKGRLWKNGVLSPIGDPLSYATYLSSVFVSGNDVYIAGTEFSSPSYGLATLWKNGVPTPLTNGSLSSGARAVAVSGSDVYVVGSEQRTTTVPVIWKNGVAAYLQDHYVVEGMQIINSDVYLAGHGLGMALRWINGVPLSVSNRPHSYGFGIFVK